MASTFSASFAGIGKMLRSDEIRTEMERRAGLVRDLAEATAPSDPTNKTHFKDAFKVEIRETRVGYTDRVHAVVVNYDDAAWQIELGTADTPAHRTLTRALDAAAD